MFVSGKPNTGAAGENRTLALSSKYVCVKSRPDEGHYKEHVIRENQTLVLLERIELSTSPLPRECSTSELQQRRVGG